MADTRVVRLSSGEYVICKLTANEDGTVTLFDAFAFQLMPSRDQERADLAFYPAFPFAQDPTNVTLEKGAISYSMPPNAQIESAFYERTTGLVVPMTSKNIIS